MGPWLELVQRANDLALWPVCEKHPLQFCYDQLYGHELRYRAFLCTPLF